MTPLDWSHATTSLPSPRTFSREATAAGCAAAAGQLGILACDRLTASYTIRPLGGGKYAVSGECRADVQQACVVTLEPVSASLVLPVEVTFVPGSAVIDPDRRPVRPGSRRDESTADEDGDSEVLALPELEVIENGQVDVGRIIFEVLAAGLEPYPRKPGATFAWEDATAKKSKVHPFAVLAKLKPQG